MLPSPAWCEDSAMRAVTTQGDLPDEHESRDHLESVPAWDDYWGRILELEVHGYSQEWEGAAEYGKRWVCELSRGAERISVTSNDRLARKAESRGNAYAARRLSSSRARSRFCRSQSVSRVLSASLAGHSQDFTVGNGTPRCRATSGAVKPRGRFASYDRAALAKGTAGVEATLRRWVTFWMPTPAR